MDPHHPAALVAVVAVFGLAFGSFANVVIYRVPRGESVVSPPSRCPSCGTQLRGTDNVPVLSWVVLRGRCRYCGAAISPRYPVVEAATAIVFVVTAIVVGLSWQLLPFLVLGSSLVVVVGIAIDGFPTPTPVLAALAVAVAANAVVSLADGDDRSVVRALITGVVAAVLGIAAARSTPDERDTSPTTAAVGPPTPAGRSEIAQGVLCGTLGWFGGWASVVAAVAVTLVFAAALVVDITTARAARLAGSGGAPAPAPSQGAAAPGGLPWRAGRWLPAMLAYGVVLGATAAR